MVGLTAVLRAFVLVALKAESLVDCWACYLVARWVAATVAQWAAHLAASRADPTALELVASKAELMVVGTVLRKAVAWGHHWAAKMGAVWVVSSVHLKAVGLVVTSVVSSAAMTAGMSVGLKGDAMAGLMDGCWAATLAGLKAAEMVCS